MRRPPSALALTLAATACASSAEPAASPPARTAVGAHVPASGDWAYQLSREDGVTSAWLHADLDDVWRHLPATYASIGVEPSELAIDAANRRVGIRNYRTRTLADQRLSRFLYCGSSLGQPKIDNGYGRVHLVTWLEREENGTRVHTRLEGDARDTRTSTAAVSCSSTGRLERIVTDHLAQRLGTHTG
ncbi:MAG: hypothetical protein P8177_02345 [Gemmatimonadota bacterium]|jgi:hypothetical protein